MKTLVLIDSDALTRALIAQCLAGQQWRVLEAEDGEQAIEAINTGENRLVLDAVICDIRMPKINGIEAIDYFQREYPHVPLVILTGYPETEMAVSFLRKGVADYLVKPVDAERLRDAVEKAMERRHVAWAA